MFIKEPVEVTHFSNMFNEEQIKINYSNELFFEILVQLIIRGLTVDNLAESRTNYSFSNQELVEIGPKNLLKKQLVGKVLVSLNYTQSNDIFVNLITCFSFLRKICKVVSFSKRRHFSLCGYNTKNQHTF